jgi:diaminopimelate epimerase
VEGFTQACGTGAVAAAVELYLQDPHRDSVESEIEIQMPGGLLTVSLGPELGKNTLTGPVEDLGSYEIALRSQRKNQTEKI